MNLPQAPSNEWPSPQVAMQPETKPDETRSSGGVPRSGSKGHGAKSFGAFAWPVIAGILFLALWQGSVFHRIFGLHPYQLPLPSTIAASLAENRDILLSYTVYTGAEAFFGFLLGSALGFAVALVAALWPKIGKAGLGLTASVNAVPIVALAPVMNLWFGDGMGSRVAVVTAVTVAAMAVNGYKGLTSVDPAALDLMTTYAAGKRDVFWRLRLPHSLPYVFTAMKINATAAMIAAIVGEFFFSSKGLGYLLSNQIKVAQMPLAWACIVAASVIGILFYAVLALLERRAVPWHPSYRSSRNP
ncbi:ABC transporter permease [Kyrpidia sp.]|uniref:ABC transporter permease n=1 Tax=Kyrpidia sp. TaxID=2073077 RepID=UPI0025881AB6|nr:ABC transporter permease [Kyrpidia sp.]